MSGWRPRPLLSLRREAVLLLEIAVIPAGIALVFPYEAVGFSARESVRDRSPSCSFVVLSEEEERVALAAARTSWQVGKKGARGLSIDVSSSELPPTPVRRIMPDLPVSGASAAPAGYVPNSLPPTVAAPAPTALMPDVAEGPSAKRAFSKEEMLSIGE